MSLSQARIRELVKHNEKARTKVLRKPDDTNAVKLTTRFAGLLDGLLGTNDDYIIIEPKQIGAKEWERQEFGEENIEHLQDEEYQLIKYELRQWGESLPVVENSIQAVIDNHVKFSNRSWWWLSLWGYSVGLVQPDEVK